jgi:hypothetical protein
MLKLRDLYTNTITEPITSAGTTLGLAIIQYEVSLYVDTRNLAETKAFLVTCTQRLIVPNVAGYSPATTPVLLYNTYPALLIANITVNAGSNQVALIDYFPRTLNTSVITSLNTAAGSGVSIAQQYTTGSVSSQTNTFGTSSSLGFFGDAPTGDLSANSSTSLSTEQSAESTRGTTVDNSHQLSNSSSMSLKDWGSYVQLDLNGPNLTWIWGQEYPWNVIQFNAPIAAGSAVLLPPYIQQRLVDTTDPTNPIVFPPSELSLFGVDFVAKAGWLITPAASGTDAVTFTHNIRVGRGTHGFIGTSQGLGPFFASLDTVGAQPIPSSPTALDLPVYALDPLNSSTPAIIGFVPDQFDTAPTSSGSQFDITADTNDLLVRGTGFTSIMATDFTAGTVEMTLYFKVIDAERDINLSLKNWIQGGGPCQLTIQVNGQSTLTRYVDVPETGGGSDSLTVIALRYKNFTSVNYCDYLRMGLNEVTITIVATVPPPATTTYQILAIAVG